MHSIHFGVGAKCSTDAEGREGRVEGGGGEGEGRGGEGGRGSEVGQSDIM